MYSHPLCILVIDDNPLFNDMVCSFIDDCGWHSTAAMSLKAAREKIDQQPFDFILLDGFLDDGLGIELLPDIQQLDANIPVMMITSDDQQQSMQDYFKQGISDYLIKPINLELLRLKIERLHHSHLIQQELAEKKHYVEQLLELNKQEEKLARYVYEFAANHDMYDVSYEQKTMLSSAVFNGDLYLREFSPSGNISLLLLDATGHGLAAAISVLPMVSVFKTMVRKGLPLEQIVPELNQRICKETPDERFVAAVVVEIDKNRNEVKIWNGGMPDVLLVDEHCHITRHIVSTAMPLGILEGRDFELKITIISLTCEQHLLMYSDGLIEQLSESDEPFGMERLLFAIEHAGEPVNIKDNIENAFLQHIGQLPCVDDVSICQVDLLQAISQQSLTSFQKRKSPSSGEVEVNFVISGCNLFNVDILSCLEDVMQHIGVDFSVRQKGFTVAAELVNNALDHGILALDSNLKDQQNGFIQYLEERGKRIHQVKQSDQIIINLKYHPAKHQVVFKIIDSGKGYDVNAPNHQQALSGRGHLLVRQLSQTVEILPPGNTVSAVIE